jgi:hypothetical protein
MVVENQVQQLRLGSQPPGDEATADGVITCQTAQFALEPGLVSVATAQKAQPTRIGDRLREAGIGHLVHRRENDRHVHAVASGQPGRQQWVLDCGHASSPVRN